MKPIFSILILLVLNYPIKSQNAGGAGDGYVMDRFLGLLNGNSIETLFQGGSADGFAAQNRSGNLAGTDFSAFFRGGQGDGHATTQFVGLLNGTTIAGMFQGGINDGFDQTQGSTIVSSLALPIDLSIFQAIPVESEVVLKWVTISEQDNAFFNVERSFDGSAFQDILMVPGAGTSVTTQNYTAIDKAPLSGWSYYRLASHDFDGSVHYSQVEAVYFEQTSNWSLQIFDNPSQGGELRFLLNTPNNVNSVDLELLDLTGRRLLSKRIEQISGIFPASIQVPIQLPKGAYWVKASAKDGHISKLLVLQ